MSWIANQNIDEVSLEKYLDEKEHEIFELKRRIKELEFKAYSNADSEKRAKWAIQSIQDNVLAILEELKDIRLLDDIASIVEKVSVVKSIAETINQYCDQFPQPVGKSMWSKK